MRSLQKTFTSYGKGPWSDVSDELWSSASWQLKNRITHLGSLEKLLTLTREERAGVILASKDKLAMSITPYFFTLIDQTDPEDPIRRQIIPRVEEVIISPEEREDPCGEEQDMVAPGLVHRYPDRVLFMVTDRCASYCRYCTRSRLVSGVSDHHLVTRMEAALAYITKHTEVRDVLISGGDPLLLSLSRLDDLLTRLRRIPHVEFVRIGSRAPIFLPQLITEELCQLLKKHAPLFLSIHINTPNELTLESKAALDRLADSGVVMGSQSVLLRGVNNSVEVQKTLMHKLLMCRVRPYYLYQCDLITGSAHFRTSIEEGLAIVDQLRGYTTGYAVPQYVVDGPGGGGKIPLNPTYILEECEKGFKLRNYQGKSYEYPAVSERNTEKIETLMADIELSHKDILS